MLMVSGITMFSSDFARVTMLKLSLPSGAVVGSALFFFGVYLWFRGILIH
jgi:hypothetical protein